MVLKKVIESLLEKDPKQVRNPDVSQTLHELYTAKADVEAEPQTEHTASVIRLLTDMIDCILIIQ